MDVRQHLRQAHADHLPRSIRLRDGSALMGIVVAIVGGIVTETRVKVVLELPARERRWLHLRDIESME